MLAASVVCMVVSFYLHATSAVKVKLGNEAEKVADEKTSLPMDGAVEEATRKQRSVSKGNKGIVRTIHQTGSLREGNSLELSTVSADQVELEAEEEVSVKNENLNKNIEASSQPAAFKWIIAVLPPIFFLIFVTFIRKAAEKAKQEEAKDSWLNSILRVNLIQQALAVSGPDKKVARGTEDNAELGKSLLSKIEEEEDGHLLHTTKHDEEETSSEPEIEDSLVSSERLFASLAQSFHEYEDGLDNEDDIQILPASASVPSTQMEPAKLFASLADSLYEDEDGLQNNDDVQVVQAEPEVGHHVEQVDESEWNVFQGSADQC